MNGRFRLVRPSYRTVARRAGLPIAAMAIALTVPALGARADATFHTERIPLMPVNGSPLHTGFVIDTHANGPIVYAHEVYVLNGAQPNTAYQVQLLGFANGTNCTGTPLVTIPEATLMTNTSGNASGDLFFTPQQVGPFRHSTVQLQYQVLGPTGLAYETPCVVVGLD